MNIILNFICGYNWTYNKNLMLLIMKTHISNYHKSKKLKNSVIIKCGNIHSSQLEFTNSFDLGIFVMINSFLSILQNSNSSNTILAKNIKLDVNNKATKIKVLIYNTVPF